MIQKNANLLMKEVNALYIGNLSDDVDEEMLTRVFAVYGQIEYVKFMWPRSDEERRRKKCCAHIKFYLYANAYLAKKELAEKWLCG